MTETMERESFEERLLPMLREAVNERSAGRRLGRARSKRRSGRRRPKLVALAAALVLLGGTVFIAGSAFGGRQIIRVDGLQALEHPVDVERQLRDAGIDATIVDVPLLSGDPAHYWQGRWWWITVDQPEQLTQEEFDRLYAQLGELGPPDAAIPIADSRVLELPKMPGHITLFVGVDEPPGHFSVSSYDRINELSPVGTFYCLGLDPNDPAALGKALEARGYRILWFVESHNVGRQVDSPLAGTVATWAWLRGPDLVDIRLAPSGREAEKYQAAEGTFPRAETPPWAPPCT
jgi:hypothetical protein